MIAKIKSWLFNRRFEQSLSQTKIRTKAALNVAQQVAILTDDHCDMPAVKSFVKQLSSRGKNVTCLHYNSTKEEEPVAGTYTPKQLNWYGWPESEAIDQWLTPSYDIAIILVTKPSMVTTMLVKSVVADLKTGASTLIDDVDLVIDLDENEGTRELLRKITTTIDHLSAA